MPTRGRRKNKRVRVKGETHPLAASADRATPARRRKQQEREKEIRGIGFLLWVMITAWKYGLKGIKCICHGNYYIKAP